MLISSILTVEIRKGLSRPNLGMSKERKPQAILEEQGGCSKEDEARGKAGERWVCKSSICVSGTRVACLILQLVHLVLVWPVLEKAMATHSSALAWKIPWTEEPGGLQSMGSLRVGCN